jgi:hypothetical protein
MVAHNEIVKLCFGIRDGVYGPEVIPELGLEQSPIVNPRRFSRYHSKELWLKPLSGSASEVGQCVRDHIGLVVEIHVGVGREIETALDDEREEFVRVGTVKGVRLLDLRRFLARGRWSGWGSGDRSGRSVLEVLSEEY